MDELIQLFEKMNSEDKTKLINYAKNLEHRNSLLANEEFSYLQEVSDKTREFYMEILEKENLNLWGSIDNFLESNKFESLEYASCYYSKFGDIRPYIKNNKDAMFELFKLINVSRKRNGKNCINDNRIDAKRKK